MWQDDYRSSLWSNEPIAFALPQIIALSAKYCSATPASTKQWKSWCELPRRSNVPGLRRSGILAPLHMSARPSWQ